ncbi:hypothetical protein FXO38_19217 [Capsicum annuum]|nr:hypothetical protein FXO38_19217 [Capsicum annuum]
MKGFYFQHIDGGELVQITHDRPLLDFVKDLKDGDEVDVFVEHDFDDDLEVMSTSICFLEVPECNNFSKDGIGSDGNADRVLNPDLNGNEIDMPNSESGVGEIPDKDGSDIMKS